LNQDFTFLRLRDFMLLDQLHRLGTLRATAQALHLTQPAVTQILKGLEHAFGIALVERGRRGVRLTEAGLAALSRLGSAFQEAQAAQADALSAARPLLRIGATPMASLQTLPRIVEHLQAKVPQARLALSESGADVLWRQLAQGELDVLVARLPQAPLSAGLRHEVVGHEQMVLVCRRGHRLLSANLSDQSLAWLEALAQQSWVLPPQDSLAMTDFNSWFLQAGVQAPWPSVTSGSFTASLHLVAKTELLSWVPRSAFQSLSVALGLRELKVPWAMTPISIVFAARESRWDVQPIQGLRESLLQLSA
jgi:DNA-binding transcriptional LysR family regulator